MPALLLVILIASLLLLLAWVWAVSHRLETDTITAGGPVYEPPTLNTRGNDE